MIEVWKIYIRYGMWIVGTTALGRPWIYANIGFMLYLCCRERIYAFRLTPPFRRKFAERINAFPTKLNANAKSNLRTTGGGRPYKTTNRP